MRTTSPERSFTATGMSPTSVHWCGLPSTPEISSVQGRTSIKSSAWGCTCQEQPLSTMNPTLRRFGASLRPCLPEWRLACEASNALAFVRRVRGHGSTRGAFVMSASGGVDGAERIVRGAPDHGAADGSNRTAYSRLCMRSSASSTARQAWRARLIGTAVVRITVVNDRCGPSESVQIRVERTDCVHAQVERGAPAQASDIGRQGVERVGARCVECGGGSDAVDVRRLARRRRDVSLRSSAEVVGHKFASEREARTHRSKDRGCDQGRGS
eukprot:6144418-Pleurochrysis_carterae.AAC.2